MFSFVVTMTMEEHPSLTSLEVDTFDGSQGRTKFIEKEELEKSKHLADDSFTVRCDFVVINMFSDKEMYVPKCVFVLPSDLGNFLATGEGPDVVFEVAGETLAAHRLLLSSRSSVYMAELFGMMKESGTADVIHIDNAATCLVQYTDLRKTSCACCGGQVLP